MKTVAERVVRPEDVLGVGPEVLALKETERASQEMCGNIPIRPVGKILHERHWTIVARSLIARNPQVTGWYLCTDLCTRRGETP